jgi:hypothetical protein
MLATTNNKCKQGGFEQEKILIDVGVSYNIHIMMIYHRLKFLLFEN